MVLLIKVIIRCPFSHTLSLSPADSRILVKKIKEGLTVKTAGAQSVSRKDTQGETTVITPKLHHHLDNLCINSNVHVVGFI